MKCEHCGKNEVTFVYRSNVNGNVEEAHLCAGCAEKLGYTQRLATQNRSLLENFFGNGSLFPDPFSSDPFFDGFPRAFSHTARNLLGRMMEDPFDDFFADMPALSAAPVQQEESEPAQQTVQEEPKPEMSRFARLRERNALKMEMKRAIHEENFERAAELRDQLRQMEQAEP